MSAVLVVSPHPDDEAIGCGGTLCSHVAAGDAVRVVFLTSGERGCHDRPPEETGPLREREAAEAAAILRCSSIEFWREPDGGVQASAALVDRVAAELAARSPGFVYVPHDGEAHADHRAAAELVRRAVAGRDSADRPVVRMFEIWTPLQAMDDIVEISPYLERKRRAIRAHRSQCAQVDYEAAALGLNRYRGELHCWPEGEFAEAFLRMRFD